MSKEKVVLAYSCGLDTSVCVKWLQDEKNLDVVCVCGNVGQEETGLDAKKQKALDLGVLDCQVLDLRDEFSDEFLTKAIGSELDQALRVPEKMARKDAKKAVKVKALAALTAEGSPFAEDPASLALMGEVMGDLEKTAALIEEALRVCDGATPLHVVNAVQLGLI